MSADQFLIESGRILAALDRERIDHIAKELAHLREHGGRLFIMGNGGSAAHASHAVNDFRKIAGIESYCPTDNVAEFTARVNDESFEDSLTSYLIGSNFRRGHDACLLLSVGGGRRAIWPGNRGVSANLCEVAAEYPHDCYAIVGAAGGFIAGRLDHENLITIPSKETPQVEGVTSVILHCLVAHPALKR